MNVSEILLILKQSNEGGHLDRSIGLIESGNLDAASKELEIMRDIWKTGEYKRGLVINSYTDVPTYNGIDCLISELRRIALAKCL